MTGTPVPSHGFSAVRGRGYRPEQVDAYAAALCRDRDDAWERAARLTVLAKEMEGEAERLRETVARLAPQTYDTLPERARQILRLGLEEAAALREGAEDEARRLTEAAREYADGVRGAALTRAGAVRAEVEERAREVLLAARAEADETRIVARREVKEGRAEALGALREARRRTEGVLARQAGEHAERSAAFEREAEERAVAAEARNVERLARAEAALSDAERVLAETRAVVPPYLEEARERAAELLAGARVREERIARETERVLREHGELWDDVRAHMDHVRDSLTTLTGRAAAE
ncbi:cellulose-binding protein [Streptomyces sp. NPDC000983]|uniref:cellulose-binding protein n=1 Tax=Streptomyces sp. NPDC000983 TaxID=3154373 RepID=UPI003326F095